MNRSSLTTKAEGTQTDVESNRPGTNEAENRQEDENEDCCDISRQDQRGQATDELEGQEEEDQSDVTVPRNEDVNLVENSVDGEPSYQVRWERDDAAMTRDITAG